MDQVNKKKRKRVPNFTAAEKILLTKLINSRKDIIENKRTDGKMINKKKMAWEAITFEYNNNLNVHKRDTATLKRAWDNLKSAIRKARTLKGSQSNNSVAGLPSSPPDPLEVMNMVEEATAQASEESEVMYELQNTLNSDNAQSNEVENNGEPSMNALSPIVEVKQGAEFKTQTGQDNHVASNPFIDKSSGSRKASDFVRREGALRLRILEEKRKIEVEILKVQLDTRQKENLRADFLLEAAKLEVEYQRKRLYQL